MFVFITKMIIRRMKTMKNKIPILILSTIVLGSCFSAFEDAKKCTEIVSSQGEKIYIKSLRWGVTDDYQATIITSDINKMNTRSDTTGSVHLSEPFLYNFKNDTLSLFFCEEKNYEIKENFKTIKIKYTVVEFNEFWKMKNKPGYMLP